MKFIIGKKVNMTQLFGEDGTVVPVTVVSVGPVVVTQIKTKETDGYEAVQVGYGDRKEKNISKPQKGHFKTLGNFSVTKEFPAQGGPASGWSVGDKIDVSTFAVGDVLTVSATSKGKGFQGVVKRHGFKGGPRSHGQKHSEREPGSIGGGLRNKVPKGMRMAGRTGGDRVTVKNLKVVAVDAAKGVMHISGALPGRRGTIVEISSK